MTLSIRDPETDRLVRLERARGRDPRPRRARHPVAMIVDRSALVAIVLVELGWERLRESLACVADAGVSVMSPVGAGMVLVCRPGPTGAVTSCAMRSCR